MRALAVLVCLLNVWPGWGQTFNRRYDLRDIGRPQVSWDLERQLSNGHILVQGSYETDTVDTNLFFSYATIGLTRIESDGAKTWDKRLVIPWHAIVPGWANCCDSLPGGGVVIGGSKQDTLQNLAAFLMVFDSEGDTLFTRDLGIPGQQWNGFSVKRTQDGGFILVGQTDATGYLDGFAIKTDALGNVQWRRTYGAPAPITDGMLTVVQLDTGDFIVGGSHYPTDQTKQWWVQRLDPEGEVVWQVYWGPLLLGAGSQLEKTEDGRIIIASNWSYPGGGSPRTFYMAEIDPIDGDLVWEREYGSIEQFQVLFAVKEAPNTDLIACGVSEESGYMQGVLLRTTATGDSLWLRKYWYQDSLFNQGIGQFYDVLPTADGGFIATGPCYTYQPVTPYQPPGYSQDAWVVKVDSLGCIVPGCNNVGITEQATNLLGAIRIFPNPAHIECTVKLSLPPSVGNGPFELTLVASDGRTVKQERVVGNGEHRLALESLPPGLYYVHIVDAGKWLTGGKLIVE